ncbi:MAG: class I SAM-dependent RNA methyltransferase [Treponema sp.]|jgi:23S rRNA (uracil1939-C5)-methyltransferase|nr:class I SAM-dependent RNA methyltransferase [Treponema sp.]
MAKGDIAAYRIETITATGAGLTRQDGRCIFAEFTAPGELVKLRITEEQKGWAKAEVLELLEPSPQRIEPLCPLYRVCGGCNFQHLDYKAQLEAKESILKEAFGRTGSLAVPKIRIVASINPWEYRNRVQFHCLPENRKIPGFREKNGKKIIPLSDCPVADPGIRAALQEEKARLVPPPEKDRFTVYSKGDLFLSEGGNSRGSVYIGKNEAQELCLDAGVFFQSNFQMLELLLEDLKILAAKCDSDLPLGDIYCGVGTFSSFLGDRFRQAELVEENMAALDLARKNVRIKDSRFYGLKAEAWTKSRKPLKPWGLLLVDPPRTGLSGPLLRFLATVKVETLAYVSCDPVTLARDSKVLAGSGLVLKELTLYDFYPQTAHIESLAVFQKENVNE